MHWFLIPVTLCGVLIGIDTIDWIRGKLDIFDPVGIIGLLGFHFFFMAPLLHVRWDLWIRYITPPDDWRPWLGYMAVLNFLGLLMYRFSREYFSRTRKGTIKDTTLWQLNKRLFPNIIIASLLITGVSQYFVYQQYGGIQGYIGAFEAREGSFVGMGLVFMISESFPILLMIGYVVLLQRKRIKPSLMMLVTIMVLFFVLKILFGGLRGSRSETVWGLFWGIGVIHFWVRPVARWIIYGGMIVIIIFAYIYGFYKTVGSEAFTLIQSPTLFIEFEERTNKTLKTLMLTDFARADVQAFMLYRLSAYDRDYEYAWGRTYLGDISILIPRSLWPNRPVGRVKEGTDILYGMGSYSLDGRAASNVYGLSGGAMLNFGPVSVPFMFLVWGAIVGSVRRRFMIWKERSDIRLLLLPMLINLSFLVLSGDLIFLIFFIVKNGALPFAVLFICATKSTCVITE